MYWKADFLIKVSFTKKNQIREILLRSEVFAYNFKGLDRYKLANFGATHHPFSNKKLLLSKNVTLLWSLRYSIYISENITLAAISHE